MKLISPILLIIIGSLNPLLGQKIKIKNETEDVITNILIVNHENGSVDTVDFKPTLKLGKKEIQSLIFVSEYENEYRFFKQKNIVIREENLNSSVCVMEELRTAHLYFEIVNNTKYMLDYFYVKYINEDTFDKCGYLVKSKVITPGNSSRIDIYINRYNSKGEDQLKDQLIDMKVAGINELGEVKSFTIDSININDEAVVVGRRSNPSLSQQKNKPASDDPIEQFIRKTFPNEDGKQIVLTSMRFSEYPTIINNYKNLNELAIVSNQDFDSIPEDVCRHKNLVAFNFSNNKIHYLPHCVVDFKNLEWLHLDNNKLKTLPENIGNLSGLIKITVEGNELTLLPESMGSLTHLLSLDAGRNELETIPNEITDLEGLQTLSLFSNKLTGLPQNFGNLAGLSKLDLRYNAINSLPESIGKLQRLKTLELQGNELSELPESILQLSALQHLSMGDNGIVSLPDGIGSLKSLLYLVLAENKLSKLPTSLGELQQLQKLDLSSNEISGFPIPILELEALDHLDMSKNNLVAIPDNIDKLDRLTILNLSSNKLTELPESIGNLTSLTRLDLSRNALQSLPESLVSLKKLEVLHLSGNNIHEEEIQRLKASLPDCLIFVEY